MRTMVFADGFKFKVLKLLLHKNYQVWQMS